LVFDSPPSKLKLKLKAMGHFRFMFGVNNKISDKQKASALIRRLLSQFFDNWYAVLKQKQSNKFYWIFALRKGCFGCYCLLLYRKCSQRHKLLYFNK
jgi:hypothetical protein